jgi:hypothetical protein
LGQHLDEQIAKTRSATGESATVEAWKAGEELSWEAAVAERYAICALADELRSIAAELAEGTTQSSRALKK